MMSSYVCRIVVNLFNLPCIQGLTYRAKNNYRSLSKFDQVIARTKSVHFLRHCVHFASQSQNPVDYQTLY